MSRIAGLLAVLCTTLCLMAQSANPAGTGEGAKTKNEITVTGCLAKQSTDYILMQTDPGNTYELERPRKLSLKQYLGQQVEITGTKFPSMATSSDYLARSGAASPVTIRIHTIKSISKRCSGS